MRADLLENLGAQSDLLAVRAAVLVHDGGTVGGDGGSGGGITIVDNSGVIDNSADHTLVDNSEHTSVDSSVDNSVGIHTNMDTHVETNVDAGLF